MGLTARIADREAMKDIQKDFDQGFQGWEYKFNTVASSRGDYPFITITFGTGTGKFAKIASITMLNVRRKGQGKKNCKKPVLFPKLVFLYDENLHGAGKELEDVFEAGILCSSKSMYPDWLSLTGEGYEMCIRDRTSATHNINRFPFIRTPLSKIPSYRSNAKYLVP